MSTITLHESEYAALVAAKEQIIRDEQLRILDNAIRAMREIGNCESSLEEVLNWVLPELARNSEKRGWSYFDADGLTVDGFDIDGVQDPGYRYGPAYDEDGYARRNTKHRAWIADREAAGRAAHGDGWNGYDD